jgi:hypothetical protein
MIVLMRLINDRLNLTHPLQLLRSVVAEFGQNFLIVTIAFK